MGGQIGMGASRRGTFGSSASGPSIVVLGLPRRYTFIICYAGMHQPIVMRIIFVSHRCIAQCANARAPTYPCLTPVTDAIRHSDYRIPALSGDNNTDTTYRRLRARRQRPYFSSSRLPR